MTSAQQIGEWLLAAIQSIPAIDSALTGGIGFYSETNASTAKAVFGMKTDSGLLVYTNSDIADSGNSTARRHSFSFFVRISAGTYAQFFSDLETGIPTGFGGLAFWQISLGDAGEIDVLVDSADRITDEQIEDVLQIRIETYDRGWMT